MMDSLRKIANTVIFKVIFVLIILSFIFAGIGGIFSPNFLSGSNGYVAKVGDEEISKQQFEAAFNARGRNPTFNKIKSKEERYSWRKEFLNQEINALLGYSYAKRLGIRITDNIIMNYIHNNNDFKVDGKFNNERFLSLIHESGYSSSDQFAESLRYYLEQVTATRLFDSGFLLPIDSNYLDLQNQKRTAYIGKVLLSPILDKAPEPTEEEMRAYYDENQTQYQRENMLRVEYTGISLPELEEKTVVTEAEIKQYYRSHLKQMIQVARHNLSMIRVRVKNEIEQIKTFLDKGETFEDLAATRSSEKSLRDSKGNIGWYDMNDLLPKEIIDANLTKIGQISDIVTLSDGSFAIFKLNQIIPQKQKTLAEAHDEIKSQLTKEKAEKEFERLQQEGSQLTKSAANLEPISKLFGSSVQESHWLEQNRRTGKFWFFSFDELNNEINNLFDEYGRKGVISDIVYVTKERNPIIYVLRISDFQPKGMMPFEMAKPSLISTLKYQWAKKQVEEKTKRIISALEQGDNSILNKEGVVFATQYVLSRDSTDLPRSVVDKIFDTPVPIQGKSVYGYDYLEDKGATFFALIKVTDEKEHDEKKKVNISDLPRFRNLYSVMIESLREQMEVKINDDQLREM